MKLFILKTDIESNSMVQSLKPFFENHSSVTQWSVDTEDIDNVLRIETLIEMAEEEVIGLIESLGFFCESLPD